MSEAEVISRLYREKKELEEERDAVLFTYNQADKECERLRALVSRAAEALEDLNKISGVKWHPSLIAELRKAAE
jgi:hypothetical protein